eukprot:scaffold85601_cov31-Tisochrysis_lutea.AAC.6
MGSVSCANREELKSLSRRGLICHNPLASQLRRDGPKTSSASLLWLSSGGCDAKNRQRRNMPATKVHGDSSALARGAVKRYNKYGESMSADTEVMTQVETRRA